MTAALIAANHLACEPLLRAKLGAELGTTVGGFAEYMALLDGAPLAGVGVYALYDGDELSGGTGSPHQTIARQNWQVVIVAASMAEVGETMARAISALSGKRLDDSLKPLARVADANPMMAGNGLLFAFLTFSQPIDMR